MGNSLRDELLKVGLVSEERLKKKSQRPKRSKAKPAKKRARAPTSAPTAIEKSDEIAKHVLRENQRRTARFVRDATLGGGTVAENAKRALRRRIQDLVERERLNDAQADVAYHFVKGKRIKRIYVTAAQRAQLSSAQIVIAALEGNHHLLSPSAAEALLAMAPQTVVCGGAETDQDSEEHPVPDDVIW